METGGLAIEFDVIPWSTCCNIIAERAIVSKLFKWVESISDFNSGDWGGTKPDDWVWEVLIDGIDWCDWNGSGGFWFNGCCEDEPPASGAVDTCKDMFGVIIVLFWSEIGRRAHKFTSVCKETGAAYSVVELFEHEDIGTSEDFWITTLCWGGMGVGLGVGPGPLTDKDGRTLGVAGAAVALGGTVTVNLPIDVKPGPVEETWCEL